MAMLGTKENEVEGGFFFGGGVTRRRLKLPHGWLVWMDNGDPFVPFAEDGTGWGKNDPVDLTKV